jgi:hypothetical protein
LQLTVPTGYPSTGPFFFLRRREGFDTAESERYPKNRHVMQSMHTSAVTIDAKASSNELLQDGRRPILGSDAERHGHIVSLQIDFTESSKELFRDG